LTVKRCPTCKKTFTDPNLSFCIDDGTPLLSVVGPVETDADEATVVKPSAAAPESESAEPSSASDDPVPAYQPPGTYIPRDYSGQPGQQRKPRTWMWIFGFFAIVLILIGVLGVVAAIYGPNLLRAAANKNDVGPRVDSNPNRPNTNSGSNAATPNETANENSDAEDTTPPPTDKVKLLPDLKDLEDEWTVANINADKKTLNRILADDYVATIEGKTQGKADYLKTIERDTAIQHWEFEDLKATLNGDRASLTGVLRLEVKDQQGQDREAAYHFTDKFVWRDGRWQAIGSEVTPSKE
jgi:ketosteroid isomerase-like protein